jgi:hypothetical protein
MGHSAANTLLALAELAHQAAACGIPTGIQVIEVNRP